MSNTYYRQVLPNGQKIELTAIWDSEKGVHIQIHRAHLTCTIELTEQEQNDLIAGILERRGILFYPNNVPNAQLVPAQPISATGNEQSRIHPTKN